MNSDFNTNSKPWPFKNSDEQQPETHEEVVEAEAVELSPEEPKTEDPA